MTHSLLQRQSASGEVVPGCACSKVRYRSRKAARAALNRIADAPHTIGRKLPVREYRCPACGGWHLTSSVHRRDMKRAS